MSKNRFSVGGVVTVVDRAWSDKVNSGSGTRVRKRNQHSLIRKFKILGLDCKIPVQMGYNYANALIQCEETKEIWAINDCNLVAIPVITVRFMSNGQDVTDSMSEQSKEAILRAQMDGD